MKYINIILILFLFCSTNLSAQIQHEVEGDAVIDGKLGIKKVIVDPSAAVEIQSTTEGILIPRMTSAQRSAIVSPAQGLLVFDNSTNTFWFYDGTAWTELADNGATSGSTYWNLNGNDISNSNIGQVGIGLNSPTASLSVKGVVRANHLDDESEYVEIWHGSANGYINTVGDGNLDFRHDNTTFMSLSEQGYLGLGTSVPNNLLHLKSGHFEIEQGDIRFGNEGVGSGFEMDYFNGQMFMGHNTANSIQWNMVLNDNGNVGIGLTTPTNKLHIGNNGNIRIDGSADSHTLLNTLGSNNVLFQIDPQPNSVTSPSTVRLFRGTTASETSLVIYKGNNTTDHNHVFRGNGDSYMSLTGDVGIGTTDPLGYKLAVKGNIGAEEIEVRTNYWADYVFDNDYDLLSLEEVENFIDYNGHLPDVPSEKEAVQNALNLGDMDVLLLQKIEELTLYTIEQNKLIKQMRNELDALKGEK